MNVKSGVLLLTIIIAFKAGAQTNASQTFTSKTDSIREHYMDEMAIKYPLLRQVFVSSDILGNGTIDEKLYGKQLYKGKVSLSRVSAGLNLPIATFGNNRISGSFTYSLQHYNISQAAGIQFQHDTSIAINRNTFGLNLLFIHLDTVFCKPIILTGGAYGLADGAMTSHKLSYLAGFIMTLHQSKLSKFSAGLLYKYDPNSKFPVIPVITYWRKVPSAKLDIIIDLPSRIEFRKELSSRSWISLGTTLSGSSAFFAYSNPLIPRDSYYETAEVKQGGSFEYRASKKIMLGIAGGYRIPVSARAYDVNKSSSEYFLNTRMSATPFANFTISLLPFMR